MNTPNIELMRSAKTSLEGRWGIAIGAFVIYNLITIVAQVVPFGGLAVFILAGPMAVGLAIFDLNISRGKDVQVEQIFEGFKRNFGNYIAAHLLMTLFIFLWMLLLIIPGIVAAISYSMTFFIMADDDNIDPMEALKKSKAMMNGNKLKYFRMVLRLFGLGLLCILTLGIGFLWLAPYARVVNAKFYQDIKGDQDNQYGAITSDDLLDPEIGEEI
jgi:uncharacterized membrane protein